MSINGRNNNPLNAWTFIYSPNVVSGQYLILEAVDEGLEVDIEQLVDSILGDVGEGARDEGSRVVECHVQPTEVLDRGIHHAFAVGFLKTAIRWGTQHW